MKTLATLLGLTLILGTFPGLGEAEEAAEAPAEAPKIEEAAEAAEAPAEAEEAPPPFTLSALADDTPETLRLKDALRLLKHAQVTNKVLQGCAAEPAAAKALNNFLGRNGKTLAQVMDVIKKNGGITPEIKVLIDQEVADESAALLEKADCRTLADLVAKNTRDIYKAPDLAEDYRLIKN